MDTGLIIGYNSYDNNSMQFYDASDYEGNSLLVTDVCAVRFLFTTYNWLQNLSSNVTELLANYEYVVTSGTLVINGFTYSEGDIFVPYETVATPDTGTADATGWYTVYTEGTPGSSNYFDFNPSLMGETGDTYEDNFRFIRYEIYTTEYSAGTISVSTATQFLVKGDQDDYITIGSSKVYVGQVFTKSSNFTFTGTPTIVAFEATGTTDTWTDGNSKIIYQNYINNLSNSVLNQSEDYKDNFIRTSTCLSLAYVSSDTGIPYNPTAIQTAFNVINEDLGTKNNNIR